MLKESRQHALTGLTNEGEHGACKAALPRVAEGRLCDVRHALVEHRVGHGDDVILGTAERLHALATLGRRLVDDARDAL